MATTKNGIYYPSNYDEVADVPEDLKKMAESIDEQFDNKVDKVEGKGLSTNDFTNQDKDKLDGLENYNDAEIKQDIANIQEEQAIQNEGISDLQEIVQKQGELLIKYKNNQFNETEEGTSINVQDASDLPSTLEVSGGVRQDGTPTPDAPVEVEVVEGSVEINKVNKNWFDIDGYSYIPNWQELTINNNTFKLYSKATGTWWDTVYYKYFVKNISKNITLSFNITDIQLNETGNVCRILVDQYDELNNNLNANTYYDYKSVGQYSKNINLKENCSYIILRIYIINGKNIVGTYVEFENFQLEQGSTATDYIPHQSEVYNLPIQQPMLSGDTFVKEDGNWFEVHEWNKLIITGKENITYYNAPDTDRANTALTAYFAIDLPSYGESYDNKKGNVFCNYFNNLFDAGGLWASVNSEALNKEAVALQGTLRLRIYKTRLTNYSNDMTSTEKVNLMKQYLTERYNAGNPIYVWYKLATPNKLPCTPEQAEVLEQLYNMPTYRPVTNVFTQEDLANLKLNYVADSKIYVDNKINDLTNQVNTINELLSTTETSSILLSNLQNDLESEVM